MPRNCEGYPDPTFWQAYARIRKEEKMGKIRNCKMTPEQKAVHKRAVSLRNMNDEELVKLVDGERLTKKQIRKERTFAVASFIENLAILPGIGDATLDKIKGFAEEGQFIEPGQAGARKAQ